MFPPIDSDWIVYIQAAAPNNVSPCWVDIVGSAHYPAAYYYLSPTPDPNPTEVAFRMRLNGDPLSDNPNVYMLKEFVWGVKIEHATNAVLFTILVNASGGVYRLQVRDSSSTLIYNVPIALNSPAQPTDNVRVVDAGAHFPCFNPMMPDEDFFLDFTLPTYIFGAFNFVSSTYRMCYFTSTQANVINREEVCGMIINPPVGEPVLCVTKQIISGPTNVCANDMQTWLLLISIFNCGTVPVDEVVMTDTLNGSIVLSFPPQFTPSAGVTYDSGTRVVTWDIGTIGVNETVDLVIILTGSFTAPGHYTLDSGTVTGTDLDPIEFSDPGILVHGITQLTATKEIVSGPLSVESCKISTWTLRITVTNSGITDIPNVTVVDVLSSSFTVESGPQLTPSAGYASFIGNEIIWNIDNLVGNTSETLLITVTGFLCCGGHTVIDSGYIEGPCDQTVTFEDPGIDVLPISIPNKISVSGDILDCTTGEPLSGVLATLYDINCKIIGSFTFDRHYELSLDAGTYSVSFEKTGYVRKFLALVLQSDLDITADVNMAPKTGTVIRAGAQPPLDIDLFAGIICEKIDAEVVYSSFMCINSEAEMESLDDIVDSFSCGVVCTSKLRLTLNLEKNLIYKLDRIKELKYDTRTVWVCFPLTRCGKCKSHKCYVKVKCVHPCKEQNIVYNLAYLQFTAYLMEETDVLIKGIPLEEEC
ncbi:hypothetical protein SDC9_56841 [bioreactor metagenome]|uniref:DUF11 domain-containing protein n=1 Tax=bioreactor metagenome TaxID=1076179 RepID=A0A644X351_9ZZZZ